MFLSKRLDFILKMILYKELVFNNYYMEGEITIWCLGNKFDEILEKNISLNLNNNDNQYNKDKQYLNNLFWKSIYKAVKNEYNEKNTNITISEDYKLKIKTILKLKENIENLYVTKNSIEKFSLLLKTDLDINFFQNFYLNFDENVHIDNFINDILIHLSNKDLTPKLEDLDIVLIKFLENIKTTTDIKLSIIESLKFINFDINLDFNMEKNPIITKTITDYNVYLNSILVLNWYHDSNPEIETITFS